MSNTDTPFGLKPVKYDPSYIRKRQVDSSNATAIYRQHPVVAVTDGNVDGMAAASDDFAGVALRCYNSDGIEVNYLAASTAGYVDVLEDPFAQYEIQFEDGGTAPTAAAIFDQADLVFTHAGSSNTGISGAELSETLVGDGNNAQFVVLKLVDEPGNVWGHYAKVIVGPAEHYLKAKAAAI